MVDYKRSRQVLLNVGALQLIETKNTEFTLNLAWTRQKFSAPIRIFGSFIELKNQLTARFEITVRETNTRNRRIDSALPSEPTAGNLGYTVKPSVDYNVSTQLTARAYYELSVNKPVLSTAYPTRYTAWGIQIRFTIQ
jgi:cell surface protein SprA